MHTKKLASSRGKIPKQLISYCNLSNKNAIKFNWFFFFKTNYDLKILLVDLSCIDASVILFWGQKVII